MNPSSANGLLTLESFEIRDARREDLEKHLVELYDFLRVKPGTIIKDCDLGCSRGKECECFNEGVEYGEEHADCDGECGAYDDGFADGKLEKQNEIPDDLIGPITEVRDAREDDRLGIRVTNLNEAVDRLIAVLNDRFNI